MRDTALPLRVVVDFVDPAPSIPTEIVQFVYLCDPIGLGDLRCAVVRSTFLGYRATWDTHGTHPAFPEYVSSTLDDVQAHIKQHAHAWACDNVHESE